MAGARIGAFCIWTLTATACCSPVIAAEPDSSPSAAVNLSDVNSFALSKVNRDLIPEARRAVKYELNQRFGQPSHPVIPKELPVDAKIADGRIVYVNHCARCHGESGSGTGQDSKGLDPKPRDFRAGVFKWKSTAPRIRPTRHDLRETLRLVIPQTAMPAFPELMERDVDSVVEYLRWLSMEGEFELRLSDEVSADFSEKQVADRVLKGERRRRIVEEMVAYMTKDFREASAEALGFVAETWEQSELETSIVRPRTAPVALSEASIARGKELYLSEKTKCYICHGAEGKGDGSATKVIWPVAEVPDTKYKKAGLHDRWHNLNQPGDLTTGIYRGGDSSDDLFRRINAGIAGTAMPAYPTHALKESETWDLVNFIQSLRPEDLRGTSASPRRSPPRGIMP